MGSRYYDNSAAGPGGTTGTDDDECPSDDSGSFNLARDTTPTTYRRVQEGRYDSDDVQSDPRGTQRNYRCIVSSSSCRHDLDELGLCVRTVA